jgi:FAD/FMN-containing dehydrogenase
MVAWQKVLGLSVATNLTTLFGPHLSPQAEILHPIDNNFYAKLRKRWSNYHAPSYGIGAIKPATANDVRNIVRISVAHDIPFFATGGGHGISNYDSFNGLSIDLSHFDTIKSNAEGDCITIGGAVKIYQLVEPLAKLGRELPLGSCACVGVVGGTLGGDIGGLHGHRGLLVDLLAEVEVITAAGDLIKASLTENEDLFWALRGAGSNYGIVTSATYRLPEASNDGMYVNADFVFPATANHSFFKVVADFDDTLPSRLAITAVAFFNRIMNKVRYGPKQIGKNISLIREQARHRSQRRLLRLALRRSALSGTLPNYVPRDEQHQQRPGCRHHGRRLLQFLRPGQRRVHTKPAHQYSHGSAQADPRVNLRVVLFEARGLLAGESDFSGEIADAAVLE